MKKAIALFLLLLGIDIATKIASLQFVPPMLPKFFGYPYGGIAILACSGVTFSLNTVVNSGAAWGVFQGHPGLLFLVRLAIVGGLIAYLLFSGKQQTNKYLIWLVVVGAIGNGIDYLAYGHVIDFLHFCFWGVSFPIFNLADCYITIGVLSLLLFSRSAQLQSSR